MYKPSLAALVLGMVATGCTPQVIDNGASGSEEGTTVSSTDEALRGCQGHASSSIPDDQIYVLTTFGGPGESGRMSCGSSTSNGSWYYAASRQRYGCGSKIRITTNNKCVVAQTDDYGPDLCVENAANRPIIDVSPKVARALFGVSAAGWSEHRTVRVEQADDNAVLGPCDPAADNAPMMPDPTPDSPAPLTQCDSATLGCNIPVTQCVQSSSDQRFYQCTALGWVKLYADGTGLLGACTATYPLGSSCPAQ
jgi:hypothetical protein